ILMPALKQMLILFIGPERTNGLSLRVSFLYMYDFYFYLFLALEIAFLFGTIRLRIGVRRNHAPLHLHPGFYPLRAPIRPPPVRSRGSCPPFIPPAPPGLPPPFP